MSYKVIERIYVSLLTSGGWNVAQSSGFEEIRTIKEFHLTCPCTSNRNSECGNKDDRRSYSFYFCEISRRLTFILLKEVQYLNHNFVYLQYVIIVQVIIFRNLKGN